MYQFQCPGWTRSIAGGAVGAGWVCAWGSEAVMRSR